MLAGQTEVEVEVEVEAQEQVQVIQRARLVKIELIPSISYADLNPVPILFNRGVHTVRPSHPSGKVVLKLQEYRESNR
jgi:hypothetical protein